jgi:glycolate oxidase FAD binding subunit
VARLTPASLDEAQALLAEGGRRVLFVGGGTAMTPGPPVDLEIATGKLDRVVEYAPADQVVTVECGVTLAQLQGELGKHGQRLALDPPQPEKATLGGIVASNSFGPLRTRYGSIRDLIIGVSIVRADGTRAKGGGKVVKTVAGFDLPKLMCGSWGTLAFIATATFRVHPVPEQILTLCARGSDPLELVRRVRAMQLEPAAMIALGHDGQWDVYIRFEGFTAGVRAQRDKLRELEEIRWPAPDTGAVRVRFGALPSHVSQLAKALGPLGARIEWLPTIGVGFAHCAEADAAALLDARRELMASGGWLVADGDWGPAPASLPLQRSVKERLDPRGLLAPGGFLA